MHSKRMENHCIRIKHISVHVEHQHRIIQPWYLARLKKSGAELGLALMAWVKTLIASSKFPVVKQNRKMHNGLVLKYHYHCHRHNHHLFHHHHHSRHHHRHHHHCCCCHSPSSTLSLLPSSSSSSQSIIIITIKIHTLTSIHCTHCLITLVWGLLSHFMSNLARASSHQYFGVGISQLIM